MRYFLLLCTILFLQVFMPSGRILAAAPTTTQISPISYAAIQPIEPTRTKKRFRLHKKQFSRGRADINEIFALVLWGLFFLFLFSIYAALPLGAILGITWLWITSLSIQFALSLFITVFMEINTPREYRGLWSTLFAFWHLLAFLVVFLIAVFFLYNSLLFFIASALVFIPVVLFIIIELIP